MKYTSLDQAIREIFGSGRTVDKKRSVPGGDINRASALTLDDGTVIFMKSNAPGFLDNYEAEVEGLEAIRKTGAIGVPAVLGLGRETGFSFLLLEYISGGKEIPDYWEIFAEELAAMHRKGRGEVYGFDRDNWIGAGKQINSTRHSWIDFFRDCRLKPQLALADRYLSPEDRKRADYLLAHLDSYLCEPEAPALIHGDLWAGNMITGNDGKGWLIDPAVYYGHPEADLAMTELFGGFSGRFYAAYREVSHLEAGYEDRRDIYNLYHLLNHLNLFGGGYLGSVLAVLRRYS